MATFLPPTNDYSNAKHHVLANLKLKVCLKWFLPYHMRIHLISELNSFILIAPKRGLISDLRDCNLACYQLRQPYLLYLTTILIFTINFRYVLHNDLQVCNTDTIRTIEDCQKEYHRLHHLKKFDPIFLE